jgi:hypothetical protein
VRFPPVERPDHVERPLNGAPGQPDPVAFQPLKRPVVVLHHHEQVIDVNLLIVLVHHPVPEIGVGGVPWLQEVGRLERAGGKESSTILKILVLLPERVDRPARI